MKIQVRFFASLRELMGKTSLEVEVPEGTTAGELLQRLLPAEALPKVPSSLLYAVNQEYASATHVLSPGDEVVFVPPVSGG